jgi:predicted small metal-binding protein
VIKLACNDVVAGLGCEYVAEGDTPDQVHDAMMAHGGATHGDLMAGMSHEEATTAKDQMAARIKGLIANRG